MVQKQTDLDAFEQVVEDVCEEIGDYLKTLQKSDASVYYFASSDKERVTKEYRQRGNLCH